MFSFKQNGSNRAILNDIANKINNSGIQHGHIKPEDNENSIVKPLVPKTDINQNEMEIYKPLSKSPRDIDDAFFVTEYVTDIMGYLFHQEDLYPISCKFLDQASDKIKEARSRLVNCLVKAQIKFDLSQEVLFLMVQIMDRYLDLVPLENVDLVLLSACSFFIASKFDSRIGINLSIVNKMATSTYTRSDIRQMEVNILNKLGFSLSKPISLNFLRRFSIVSGVPNEEHILAKYFLELSLLDFEFSVMKPSYVAASALCLTFRLFKRFEWSIRLEYESKYKMVDLRHGMQKLAQLVVKVNRTESEFQETYKKFKNARYFHLSTCRELQGFEIREISN
ncbi:G2 mitotic-specific cyclin-B2, partial [Brachionus plicatilis]